ncbi:MAG: glycosyltransferase [Gammaproteobacteria bacterium]|nr:glycosyltransferase [Gammaproteobacteria bacterium]
MTGSEPARTIWFHRAFKAVTGGEVKHSHYFAHAGHLAGFSTRIAFTGGPLNEALAAERRRLWPVGNVEGAAGWTPAQEDMLFLAGTDWRYLSARGLGGTDHPRLNLVQHVRHADPDTELWSYLPRRAIRICVSPEVADAITRTGRPQGPVIAIPNATELPPWDWERAGGCGAWKDRQRPVAVVGYKDPELAASLSERLRRDGVEHEVLARVRARGSFLSQLAETRVAVCLPDPTEGFYLPALEAMASGCVVVTVDAVGNRGFCRDGENCIVAERDPESLARAVGHAFWLRQDARGRFLASAADTVAAHALHVERSRFHAVLRDVDGLWAEAGRSAVATGADRPRLSFMIVGAQKAGTSALAQFLDAHPEIGMSSLKEVHLFDAPEYSGEWTSADVDQRYRPHFAHTRFTGLPGDPVLGEATPVYLFLRDVPAELRRYHPELKLIVLLRDPVERAISHYYMEKGRGGEQRPLWQALLLEPFRLLRSRDPRHPESAQRMHSYRARGLYSRQLRNLYGVFPPEQVLVVRAEDLLRDHDAVLARVFAFLEVSTEVRVPPAVVFEGEPGRRRHRLLSWSLRLSYLAEFVRLRALQRQGRVHDANPKADT